MELTPLRFYLIALRPQTTFAGRVNSAPVSPWMTIHYDAGVNSGDHTRAGNTVWLGSTLGGRERGILRLRSALVTGSATGSLDVMENDDIGPLVQDDDYITIKSEFRLWPIYPRIVQVSDSEVQYFEDYDIAYTDQTSNWKPVAVAGPPAVVFLEGGSATASFVGDRSFALAPSATISSYLWTFYDGSGGTTTDSNQGTEAAPVTKTYTAAGQYLVSLTVTDSNSKSHTVYTWVFVVDPASPSPVAFDDFYSISDSMDFEQGGGECSFIVRGDTGISAFPEGTLIVHASRGTLTTATGSWPNRTNVLFVGYILGGTVRQNPRTGNVSFRAATVDNLLRNITMWPASLTDRTGPTDWTMAKNLTVDRAASFLWRWRSTLANMTPIQRIGYSPQIARQDFGPTNIHQELQTLLANAWGHVVCNHQGVLYHVHNYQTMLGSEQAAVTPRKLLHKGIWVGDVDIEEQADYTKSVRQVKQSGIYYPGGEGEVTPLFSEAPGDAPKSFGSEEGPGNLILNSQADLNARCGATFWAAAQRYPIVRMKFLNDGSFTVTPQEIFPASIEPGDNDRGLNLSLRLLPRRITRSYDHAGGYMTAEVEFEPAVTGSTAGITVEMPAEPPEPELPEWDPSPPTPWTPPSAPPIGACVSADKVSGPYWSYTSGVTWGARRNGLATEEFAFLDLVWDPWWMDRTGGHNPDEVILWGVGTGFIVKSTDAGLNWTNLASLLSEPPDAWNDTGNGEGTPTKETVTYKQIHGDIHNKGRFYVLVEWQNNSNAWRGWILKIDSDTAGFSHTWMVLGNPGVNVTCNFNAGTEGWVFQTVRYPGTTVGTWNSIAGRLQITHYPASGTKGGEWIYTPTTSWVVATGDFIRLYIAEWTDGTDSRLYIHFKDGTVKQSNVRYNSGTSLVWCTYTVPAADDGREIDYIEAASDATYSGTGYWQWDNFTASIGGGTEIRPLWMDLDTKSGENIYLTSYRDGYLYCDRHRTSDLAKIASYSLGAATTAEVSSRALWAAPLAPHLPETASAEDYAYVYGRFDVSGIKRLYKTDDGCASFSDKSDASWGTGTAWVGALDVASDDLVIHAFLNDAASPTLQKSTDGGSNWAQINTLPFNVDPDGISKHWGATADFLIGNRDAGALQAARLAAPYTDTWININTGLPGGGLCAVIWV